MSKPLIEVHNLQTSFLTTEGEVKAVDGVSFSLEKGETLGLVGESGSGKSMTALSILRLIPEPLGKIVAGEILFQGENLLKKSEKELRQIRGNQISMVFQEPMTSLNPVLSVGKQIAESLRLHQQLTRQQAWQKTVELLQLVGIPDPDKRAKNYPFELSGGMRQRVMIALALAGHPQLLIADEPTTALDVTIQAQILELLKKLQQELGMAIILITHDLGIVAETCDKVIVMYAGQVLEYAQVDTLFTHPKHPYTQGLLRSLPRADQDVEELAVIPGTLPSPFALPKGCRFAPRCPQAKTICQQETPIFLSKDESQVRCWLYSNQSKEIKEVFPSP